MAEEEFVDQQELFEHYRFKADPGTIAFENR